MKIRDADLILLRKDIERVRKHEEKRRSEEQPSPSKEAAPEPVPGANRSEQDLSITIRIKRLLDGLLGPPEPSRESLEAIPHYVVTVLSVIREEPKFRTWLLALENFPLMHRNQQLEEMSRAFRIEDKKSMIAAAFDRFHEPALFKAVCQLLRDEAQARS